MKHKNAHGSVKRHRDRQFFETLTQVEIFTDSPETE